MNAPARRPISSRLGWIDSVPAAELSDLAGRGVCASAVRRAVLALGGSIDVQSTIGQGTTIEISVPIGGEVYVPSPGLSLLPR